MQQLKSNCFLEEMKCGPLSVVIDTDTYNEIDDQFAMVYALLSPERLNIEAFYAAPFYAENAINDRSESPADGMEKSYHEIMRVLKNMGDDFDLPVFRGATHYLSDSSAPVEYDAVADLIARAKADRPGPLYIIAIAALTNVASAILAAPEIIDRITVVWLGGTPHKWHTANEFNLMQDVKAAQIVFDSGVSLVHVPCKNVAEHLRTTVPEMARYVRDHGKIGKYLYGIFSNYYPDHCGWSKPVWDIAPVAFLVNSDWVPVSLVPSPVLTDRQTWEEDCSRHMIWEAIELDRDAIFRDLFDKLAAHAIQAPCFQDAEEAAV